MQKSETRRLVVSGRVLKGLGLGRTIGVPTMNLHPKKMPSHMPHGIYAVIVHTSMGDFMGALHYGLRKTHNAPISLEVHALGLNQNMYRRKIQIEFVKRLRATKKFKNISDLKKAIQKDIRMVKKLRYN